MEEPWFKDGLRFTCTRCGRCCTGEPGAVHVNDEELVAIAEYRRQTVTSLVQDYTRRRAGQLLLREKPNRDCVFWDRDEGCLIYPVRPRQCRTWPFWRSNVETPEAWERTQRACPGAGKGEHHSAAEVEDRVKLIDL